MSPESQDPFRLDNYACVPTLTDDLVYLAEYSYSRIRSLFGVTSSVSQLEINNGVSELILGLRRQPVIMGAVIQLKRRISLYTDLSSSEAYRNAVKACFLKILKAGHAHPAYEFYEEFGKGIDFADEIRQGFFHLGTEAFPAIYVTHIKGDIKSEELLSPERWDVNSTLDVYKIFKNKIDFQQACKDVIAHLLNIGRREDALLFFNTFKNRVRLSSFDQQEK